MTNEINKDNQEVTDMDQQVEMPVTDTGSEPTEQEIPEGEDIVEEVDDDDEDDDIDDDDDDSDEDDSSTTTE